jgi:hypothetical protein
MSEDISEKELIKLLKKLDEAPSSQVCEGSRSFSSANQGVYANDEVTNGFIKIEQGKITVGSPTNGGKFPTLKATQPVKLLVDGNQVNKETMVTSESVIHWEVEEKPLFEITISGDKIEAYLTIYRTQRHAWILTEKAPSLNVTLTAEEDLSIVLETLSLQDIIMAVENLKIKMNLDVVAIQTEILRPSSRPVTIARGKVPIQGRDAQLDLYFPENIENIFTEVRGYTDYKNHMNIPSVKKGDVIARKTPPVEGNTGYDVFGNVLFPETIKDIRIAGKNNVEITPDSIVIALKEGRPRVTGNHVKYFEINTAFIVPGNVDMQTGNIVFAGDVIVYGDVTDNMIVESLGNIYVAGSVFNATLTATGSIAVKGNVIGSNLYSGYFGMLYNRLYNCSKQLIEIFEKMTKSAKLLLNELAKKSMQARFGQVLVLITENKYQNVGGIVKELLSVISTIQSHNKDDLQQLQYYLELFLLPVKIIEVMTAPRMEDFLRILKDAFMRVELSQETNVQIVINRGQKSILKSNGDILIRKEGVIQCNLYSAGCIIFFLDNSVCRGSKLEAGDTISAMFVGGTTGVWTSLKAAKKVIVKKMFEGKIIVDRYSVDIFEPIEEKTFDRHSIRQMA